MAFIAWMLNMHRVQKPVDIKAALMHLNTLELVQLREAWTLRPQWRFQSQKGLNNISSYILWAVLELFHVWFLLLLYI